jgi:hypothetical protein
MNRKAGVPRPARLEQVRRRVEDWRRTRGRLGRMPEELWGAAVELAREHGAYGTARGLGINYGTLRKRMGARLKRSAGPRSEFVELSPGLGIGGAPASAVVELSSSGGEKLTIRLAGPGEWSVLEVCREFWSRAG